MHTWTQSGRPGCPRRDECMWSVWKSATLRVCLCIQLHTYRSGGSAGVTRARATRFLSTRWMQDAVHWKVFRCSRGIRLNSLSLSSDNAENKVPVSQSFIVNLHLETMPHPSTNTTASLNVNVKTEMSLKKWDVDYSWHIHSARRGETSGLEFRFCFKNRRSAWMDGGYTSREELVYLVILTVLPAGPVERSPSEEPFFKNNCP